MYSYLMWYIANTYLYMSSTKCLWNYELVLNFYVRLSSNPIKVSAIL